MAFWAAFGWFFTYYNPKSSPITVFDIFLKLPRNGPKKPILRIFFRGFWATPSYPLSATPKSFVKWKVSWRDTTVPSFIFIAIVVLKSYKFSKVLEAMEQPWIWPFWGFLGPNSPKNAFILLKLEPEVDLMEKNTVLKFYFFQKLHLTKVYFFFQFWPNFGAHLPHEGCRNRKK